MKRITIERNKNASELGCAGQIEGETDDGRRWILFMDEHGAPEVFWPKRAEDGAVVGRSVDLSDKDQLGAVYGTKEHPMTYSEWCAAPRTGTVDNCGD